MASPVVPQTDSGKTFAWEADDIGLQELLWERFGTGGGDDSGEGEEEEAIDDDPESWVMDNRWEPEDSVWVDVEGVAAAGAAKSEIRSDMAAGSASSGMATGSAASGMASGSAAAGMAHGSASPSGSAAPGMATESAAPGMTDEPAPEVEFPPWADARNHVSNNANRDGKRGAYDVNQRGLPVFQAKPEYGGKEWGAGMGRKRGRTRGSGSVVIQRNKYNDKHGKGTGAAGDKGKGKGKSDGKSKSKGKDKGHNKGKTIDYGKGKNIGHDNSQGEAINRALLTMSTMADSTAKLINMVEAGNRDTPKQEPKQEQSSSSSSSWRGNHNKREYTKREWWY